MAEVSKMSDAELAAIAGGYIDTWRSASVEAIGAMASLCKLNHEWFAEELIVKEMNRRFPDHAPQEIERRKL